MKSELLSLISARGSSTLAILKAIGRLSNGTGKSAGIAREQLVGTWRLLWTDDDRTRSSPFFWAFKQAFGESLSGRVFAITDAIPEQLKRVGEARQCFQADGRLVSMVPISSPVGSSVMTTTSRWALVRAPSAAAAAAAAAAGASAVASAGAGRAAGSGPGAGLGQGLELELELRVEQTEVRDSTLQKALSSLPLRLPFPFPFPFPFSGSSSSSSSSSGSSTGSSSSSGSGSSTGSSSSSGSGSSTGAGAGASLPAFPSGAALELVSPGSSTVRVQTLFQDQGLRVVRNPADDRVFVFEKEGGAGAGH